MGGRKKEKRKKALMIEAKGKIAICPRLYYFAEKN